MDAGQARSTQHEPPARRWSVEADFGPISPGSARRPRAGTAGPRNAAPSRRAAEASAAAPGACRSRSRGSTGGATEAAALASDDRAGDLDLRGRRGLGSLLGNHQNKLAGDDAPGSCRGHRGRLRRRGAWHCDPPRSHVCGRRPRQRPGRTTAARAGPYVTATLRDCDAAGERRRPTNCRSEPVLEG